MAKVNLRNRLRENYGNNEPSPDSVNTSVNTEHEQQPVQENIITQPEPVSVPKAEPVAQTEPQSVHTPVVTPPLITQKPKPVEYTPPQPQTINPPAANNRTFNNADTGSIFKNDETNRKRTKNLEHPGNDKKNILDKMNVNKRMLYIALGCAAIASFLVITYLMSISEDRLYGSKMVTVLVANKDIKEKTVLSLSDLAKKEIPKKFVPANAVILDGKFDPETLVGKIALTDLYEDEQITLKRIAAQQDSPWLSPAVPENHRAFTITSKSLSYIKPSDHVDILVSLPDPKNKERTIITPVLQNVLVLAVDGKYKISTGDELTNGRSITVAAPNKYITILSILEEKGNFQVALRRENDLNNLETKYTTEQLEKLLLYEDKPAPAPKPAVIREEKPYIPPPAPVVKKQPVYNTPVQRKPVYTPPKPKPVQPKPVAVKQQPAPVKPKVEQPKQHQTVTVINGPRIDTQEYEVKGKE